MHSFIYIYRGVAVVDVGSSAGRAVLPYPPESSQHVFDDISAFKDICVFKDICSTCA